MHYAAVNAITVLTRVPRELNAEHSTRTAAKNIRRCRLNSPVITLTELRSDVRHVLQNLIVGRALCIMCG